MVAVARYCANTQMSVLLVSVLLAMPTFCNEVVLFVYILVNNQGSNDVDFWVYLCIGCIPFHKSSQIILPVHQHYLS